MSAPMRFRTSPALIRAALIDAERTTVHAAACRIGVRDSRIYAWRKFAREADGVWPSDDDIATWAERRQAREKDKQYRISRLTVGRRTVDPRGTQRRLRALRAIGWTWNQLADELGVTKSVPFQFGSDKPRGVYRETAEEVAALYERLSMQPQYGWVADRARARSARLGYAPPLAWDDIDKDERPHHAFDGDEHFVDWAVVDRILAGQFDLRCNRAERLEVIARWAGSDAQLDRETGWNVARDRRDLAAQSTEGDAA